MLVRGVARSIPDEHKSKITFHAKYWCRGRKGAGPGPLRMQAESKTSFNVVVGKNDGFGPLFTLRIYQVCFMPCNGRRGVADLAICENKLKTKCQAT